MYGDRWREKIYHAEAQGDGLNHVLSFQRTMLELSLAKHVGVAAGSDRLHHFVCPRQRNKPRLWQDDVKPERKFIGRAKQRIAFISDPDGNSIELMEIPPESEI